MPQFRPPETMDADQVKALIESTQGGRRKQGGDVTRHGNVLTEAHGRKFHSKAEADRYAELLFRRFHGDIHFLECQVPFRFEHNGVLIGTYRADFAYLEDGWYIVEDKKGHATDEYKRTKKLMRAFYGIEIRET